MAMLCHTSVSILRRGLGLADVSRLISTSQTTRISSQEILERENKVIAKNYEPLPVVIAKGEGTSTPTQHDEHAKETYRLENLTNSAQAFTCGTSKGKNIWTFSPVLQPSIRVTAIRKLWQRCANKSEFYIILPEPLVTIYCTRFQKN